MHKGERDSAFETLYREQQNTIIRLCYLYLGDRALAEDAAQETFYKAYKGLHRFQRRSDIATWLTRIAINVCKDLLRKRRHLPLDEAASVPADEPDHDTRLTVSAAISLLEPRYREVVILYYYRELCQKEIARALRISESAVAKRLERARHMLKVRLKEDFS